MFMYTCVALFTNTAAPGFFFQKHNRIGRPSEGFYQSNKFSGPGKDQLTPVQANVSYLLQLDEPVNWSGTAVAGG